MEDGDVSIQPQHALGGIDGATERAYLLAVAWCGPLAVLDHLFNSLCDLRSSTSDIRGSEIFEWSS